MARTDNLTNFLTDVADAIRTKTGSTEPIQASSFDTAIENIPSGQSSPTSIEEINNYAKGYIDYLRSLSDNYEVDTTDAITLYTPHENYKVYCIVRLVTGYFRIIWLKNGCILGLDGNNLSNTSLRYCGITSRSGAIDNSSPNFILNATYTGDIYRSSDVYSTIEQCLEAIKKPETTYATTSSQSINASNKIEIPYTNTSGIKIINYSDSGHITSKKISSNETIEVIPSS